MFMALLQKKFVAAREQIPRAPGDPVAAFAKAVDELADDEGWVRLGILGQRLLANHPDFDPRSYGCAKLSDLVTRAGRYETRKTGNQIEVRRLD